MGNGNVEDGITLGHKETNPLWGLQAKGTSFSAPSSTQF